MSSKKDNSDVLISVLPETKEALAVGESFLKVFGGKPEFYVKVPGRVNLIGEHIDYCGYGVCPMALEQNIFIAVSVDNKGNALSLHNVDPKFEDFHCKIDGDIEINLHGKAPKWHQYFLCGLKGILETISESEKHITGLKVVVHGTVPLGAGLSSSSALVSAAALSTAYAFKQSLSKEYLADLCAQCERYIGTIGGGMDQAIAFLATEGCAKMIEFNPLRSRDVRLPTDAVFVIAHSLTNLNKAATGHFNTRVVECRMAAQILAKRSNLDWIKVKRLGELQKLLNKDLSQMIRLTENALHEEPYSKQDIVNELETTSDQLEEISMTPNTRDVKEFKLRQRALHVFNEALRVEQFYTSCQNASAGDTTILTLQKLMCESHESLKNIYECSNDALDKIVELSATLPFTVGTRLTGAGWGGCTVSLLTTSTAEKYIEFLKENYYKQQGVSDNFESILFRTTPMAGATIYLENLQECVIHSVSHK